MTDPGTLVKRAAIASVAVSLFLVAIKAAAYFASHSVALLASMADSALDLFASGLNMLAIRQALTPADAEHRFGHGKAEPLAGLAQGAFIAASALFISLQAVQHIVTPEPIDNSIPALIVMCISIVSTFLLVMYQRQVVASTGSLAVDADSGHYASDLITNLGVILALRNGYLLEAYTLDLSDGLEGWPAVPKYLAIGIGMWLGTIMWFNVWFVIWPNQQKALNIGGKYPDLAPADKAAAGKTAMIFSRVNTLLSMPMLFAMVAAGHLY